MATRSRTQLFRKYRDAAKTHRKPSLPKPADEKINRNLLDMRAALSDDEGGMDARVYSVPPVWVVTVQDLKRDVLSIESKSKRHRSRTLANCARRPTEPCGTHAPRPCSHPRAPVKELDQVSSKHLLPGFGEEEDHEDTIARTVQEITQLFKDCERRLKEIHAAQNDGSGDEVCRPPPTPPGRGEGGGGDPTPGEASPRPPSRGRGRHGLRTRRGAGQGGGAWRGHAQPLPPCGRCMQQAVRKNIEQRVAKQLQDLSLEFRRGHKGYLAKLKGQGADDDFKPDLRRDSGAAGPSGAAGGGGGGGGGGFFDDDMESGGGAAPIDPRFNSQQTLQLVMAEQMSEERSKAIEQVAESVGELAGIFKEIQVLVIDQGTILDRIDFNIEMAADKVGKATLEIDKANQYQKKSKAMLCIYLLLLLCCLMVIVLILKKSLGGR